MSGLEPTSLLILSLITVFSYCFYIKVFRRLSQTEREEGLRSHKKKNGTITMGGIMFIILPLFFIPYVKEVILIVIAVVGFGLIGFVDDLLIIKYKKNDGLSARFKLIIEIFLSGLIFYYYLSLEKNTIVDLYFFKFELKWIFGLFILWLLTASCNAWNLLDGVDGLCSGCSLLIFIGLMIIAWKKNEIFIFWTLLVFGIVVFIFWCFNLPKAFLFMGDVGSLALGALLAITSIYLNCLVSFIVMAGLFIFDTFSVILQVFFYKKTKKRLFKMAPFHHHLEMSGFSEIKVDLLFYFIQIILVIIGVLLS